MISFQEQIIKKYSVIGPRYTSYPTAPVWHEIDRSTLKQWFSQINSNTRPLSIYIHIPFCKDRCAYCGCNVIVTRQQHQIVDYVSLLLAEIDHMAKTLLSPPKIRQLHFGGGTPNYLLNDEFQRIMDKIHSHFDFEEDAEIAMEIDPCSTRPGQLEFLRGQGINRLSFGVQDLDERVQKAVNRIQSYDITLEHLQLARKIGIEGINIDLIYGLPFQTIESFQKTVDTIIEMRPDRLAVYNFGYLPDRMIHQRKIDPRTLPGVGTKLEILLNTISRFRKAGYRYIGMDHFAMPDDELSVAQEKRTLSRNFMGYTPKSNVHLFGFGMTAISEFNKYFLQNEKKLKPYKEQITSTGFAGYRGIELSRDDQIRKWTIHRLICHFFLSFSEFSTEFEINFSDYFKEELIHLEEMCNDGLLEINENNLTVINHGQILVRNICMIFDAYLKKSDTLKVRYSKTL